MTEATEIEKLKEEWLSLIRQLDLEFGPDLDLQGIIFLIGVQEFGKGRKDFSKEEKQDLMHIATCRVLSSFGFYELTGKDEDGWPHWQSKNRLPAMSLKEQDILLKKAVLNYFRESGVFT